MANIINASIVGLGGLISTADNSGILQLQTTGTTALTIDASQNVSFVKSITAPNFPGQIQPITASVGSNALTCTLNPTILNFRNTPLTDGTVNTRTISSPISLVVPSGATLGTISAIQSRLVLLALDNAGVVELAIINIYGIGNADETGLVSTTAISAGATASNVAYSITGRTSLPYRVVGYIESTQATAGTWATAPSTIQGCGGQALAAMGSFGIGQLWQGVTRNSGTTYYNTTGRTIFLCIHQGGGVPSSGSISVNGFTTGNWSNQGYGTYYTQYAVIPPSGSYLITVGVGTTSATELR